eukprot:3062919-Rhodomonas_salina.1
MRYGLVVHFELVAAYAPRAVRDPNAVVKLGARRERTLLRGLQYNELVPPEQREDGHRVLRPASHVSAALARYGHGRGHGEGHEGVTVRVTAVHM